MPSITRFFDASRHFKVSARPAKCPSNKGMEQDNFYISRFLFDPSAQEAFIETDAVFKTASV
jgi:hypothetical protein